MVINSSQSRAELPPCNSNAQWDSGFETRTKCGKPWSKLMLDSRTKERLRDLFSTPNPPYALTGGAALHYIFLGSRTPNDIDLRCDDLEATRREFASRFEEVPRKTMVPVYGFRDENGVFIDITQNRFDRVKKPLPVRHSAHCLSQESFQVLSYDFEVHFADKLFALARKGGLTDLFDAYSCTAMQFDLGRLSAQVRDIGEHDDIKPARLLAPSYSLNPDLMWSYPQIGITVDQMLEKVRAFVRSIL